MDLKIIKNIFFLGIKGVAMANLAIILKKAGKHIFGVDEKKKYITDKLLKKNQINYQENFDLKNLNQPIDLFVYSAAHGGINHPLAKLAKEKNIKLISQAELIGEIIKEFKTKIAISGCHGKTTTSSLLAYLLIKLGKKPSYLVGVPYFDSIKGGDYQDKDYFIVEADEYGVNPPFDKTPKFFKLNPDWIICTNIDFDHPDVYENLEETKQIFKKFFDNKKLVLCGDDKNLKELIPYLKNKKIITYGFSENVDYKIVDFKTDEEKTIFKLNNQEFVISLFGKHNVLNATAVISILYELGFSYDNIKKAIVGFKGAQRRLNLIYHGNFYLFDDYAHHPTEIEATIDALRQRYKNKRIYLIFQPHTFSRTLKLLNEFRVSLSKADFGLILPIFPSARETNINYNISSQDIVEGIDNLKFVNNDKEAIKFLFKLLKKEDIVLLIGAGDIYKISQKIIDYDRSR